MNLKDISCVLKNKPTLLAKNIKVVNAIFNQRTNREEF